MAAMLSLPRGVPCGDCARCTGPWGLSLGLAPSNLDLQHVLSQGSLSVGFSAQTRGQKLLPEVGQSLLMWFHVFT